MDKTGIRAKVRQLARELGIWGACRGELERALITMAAQEGIPLPEFWEILRPIGFPF
jgi:hypothetical protein